jgi:glycosyltransferase involved in cell wall biosynthesis
MQQPMNVAYLINVYPRPNQTFIWREMRALEASGIKVHRFALRACEERVDAVEDSERMSTRYILKTSPLVLASACLAAVFSAPAPALRSLALAWTIGRWSERGVLRSLMCWVEACVLRKWMAESDIEHLHAHYGTNTAAIAMLCSIMGGTPYSFTVHGPEEFDAPKSLSLGDKIRHAAFVVAVSKFGKSQLYRWCDYKHWGKIHVVRCGVDGLFLEGDALPVPASPNLISIGRLSEQKGQPLLLEAAASLVARGIPLELTIVGDGEMRQELEAMVRRLGLGGRVTLAGWKDAAAIRQMILQSRALVMPSFAEGLPVVVMEALALNRPVVSTYIAGIPELVEEGICGFLVPAGSVSALASALAKVVTADAAELEKMGAAGRKRVQEQHNATTEAGRLAKLIRASIDSVRQGGPAATEQNVVPLGN